MLTTGLTNVRACLSLWKASPVEKAYYSRRNKGDEMLTTKQSPTQTSRCPHLRHPSAGPHGLLPGPPQCVPRSPPPPLPPPPHSAFPAQKPEGSSQNMSQVTSLLETRQWLPVLLRCQCRCLQMDCRALRVEAVRPRPTFRSPALPRRPHWPLCCCWIPELVAGPGALQR